MLAAVITIGGRREGGCGVGETGMLVVAISVDTYSFLLKWPRNVVASRCTHPGHWVMPHSEVCKVAKNSSALAIAVVMKRSGGGGMEGGPGWAYF